MDRRDDVRPALAGFAEGDRPPACRRRLGPVHVGVDDVRPDLGEVGGQGADGDRVVGLVDDEDGERRPAGACGRRSRPTARRPTRRSAPGRAGSPARRGAPGRRRSCRSRGPRRRGSAARPAGVGRVERASRQGSQRRRCAHRQPSRSSDEQALDRLVDRAPLVLVGLVAAQEVEPAACRASSARCDVGVDHQRRPATGRAHRGRRRRCSRGSRRPSRSGCPAAIRRSPTVRNARRSGPSAP